MNNIQVKKLSLTENTTVEDLIGKEINITISDSYNSILLVNDNNNNNVLFYIDENGVGRPVMMLPYNHDNSNENNNQPEDNSEGEPYHSDSPSNDD